MHTSKEKYVKDNKAWDAVFRYLPTTSIFRLWRKIRRVLFVKSEIT